jgi:hypothetical protein
MTMKKLKIAMQRIKNPERTKQITLKWIKKNRPEKE